MRACAAGPGLMLRLIAATSQLPVRLWPRHPGHGRRCVGMRCGQRLDSPPWSPQLWTSGVCTAGSVGDRVRLGARRGVGSAGLGMATHASASGTCSSLTRAPRRLQPARQPRHRPLLPPCWSLPSPRRPATLRAPLRGSPRRVSGRHWRASASARLQEDTVGI